MSTPVNQIKSNPNFANVPPAKLDEDVLVKGVIDEMECEVSSNKQQQQQQYEIQSTDVATIRHDAPFASRQQPPHAYQHVAGRTGSGSVTSKYWNKDDAQFAAVLALVAFAIFSQIDTGFVYRQFDALGKFQPYDMYIRALLLAVVIYVILRKNDLF